MPFSKLFNRLGLDHGWVRELFMAAVMLGVGFAIMPVAIYYVGATALGRYEGASVSGLFHSIYGGIATGSMAAWIVVFGPYVLYLLFKGLRYCWRGGPNPA